MNEIMVDRYSSVLPSPTNQPIISMPINLPSYPYSFHVLPLFLSDIFLQEKSHKQHIFSIILYYQRINEIICFVFEYFSSQTKKRMLGPILKKRMLKKEITVMPDMTC